MVIMDHIKASMNPCSVESIPEGVRLDNRPRASVWPALVNCYELQDDGSRVGRMDLFLIKGDCKLGEKQTIETGTSGILDGKWMKRENGEYWFASARSTGTSSNRFFFLSREQGK